MRTSFYSILLIILLGTLGAIASTFAQPLTPLTGMWQGRWTLDPSAFATLQKYDPVVFQAGRLSLDLTQRQSENPLGLRQERDRPSITGSATFEGNLCFRIFQVSGITLDRPDEFFLNLSSVDGVQMTATGKVQGDTLSGTYDPWSGVGFPCNTQRGTFYVSRASQAPR